MPSLTDDPFFYYWLMIMFFAVLASTSPEQIVNAINSIFGGEKKTARLTFFEANPAVDTYIDLKDYKNMHFDGFWQPYGVEYDWRGKPVYLLKVKASNPALNLEVIEDVKSNQFKQANFESILHRSGARYEIASDPETEMDFLQEQNIRLQARIDWYKAEHDRMMDDFSSMSLKWGAWGEKMGKFLAKYFTTFDKEKDKHKIEVTTPGTKPEGEMGEGGMVETE